MTRDDLDKFENRIYERLTTIWEKQAKKWNLSLSEQDRLYLGGVVESAALGISRRFERIIVARYPR